ncbi:MAG TPA: tRNA preQ1(34) S-adenosylmethionine ribosyltransferase-isomerase QueA [Gemmataceae bacterium]|nr:tRNA preQ1(34) S-adenosylmethionine ribosyltransferase-isomerase QueA [Gemmataceae bacterium]
MHIDQFDYPLPEHLIAQEPCSERDLSRLLVVRRGTKTLAHHTFRDLPRLLRAGDLLVLNDTQVLPARLLGKREQTGGKWEGLFLNERSDGTWEMIGQTRGRLVAGDRIVVKGASTPLVLTLVARTSEGHWLVRPSPAGPAAELLTRYGQVPLPPYIRKGRAAEADRERYQTVYAQHAGAVAAPTAGLHFTPRVFEELRQHGIDRAFVTLHVGIGTFQPVKVTDVSQHHVQREWAELPAATAEAIRTCRVRGGRVVAVGTTSVRVLETVAATGPIQPWSGETDLTICPPFTFRVVDALVTNFHLPRSSLLLLVAAFTGLESMRQAYRVAVEQEYRFYSYGDAMLILP